jgi:hypothetical protein
MPIALMLVQAVAAQVMAAPADLSPEARIAIAPVAAAIAEVRAKQAALPPPKDDVEKLLRMGELEQAPRVAMGKVDFLKIPIAERNNAVRAIGQQMRPIDEANQQALLAMLPPEGWFTIGKYGREASGAAFMIVQHSNPDLWRRFLPVLEPLAARGEVAGGDFALMYDRLALSEGRKQRYGSQMKCEGGKFVPMPIEDAAAVEGYRAALGMRPYAEYLANYAKAPPCGG